MHTLPRVLTPNKSKLKIWKIYNAYVLYKPNNKSWQPENENEIVRRKHRIMQVRANTGTACTSELREPSARCRPLKNTSRAPARRIPQTNAAARRWPAMTALNTLPRKMHSAYAPGKRFRRSCLEKFAKKRFGPFGYLVIIRCRVFLNWLISGSSRHFACPHVGWQYTALARRACARIANGKRFFAA